MFVLITIEAMYYNRPLNTYATHADAFRAGVATGGWFDIEEV